MMNPQIWLSALLLWLGSMAAVGVWQNHVGHTVEKATWEARETKALNDANKKILDLETAARTSEQSHAVAVNDISTDYERRLQDAQNKNARTLAALRAGTISLRDPNASACTGSNSVSGTATGTSVSNGGTGSNLPAKTSEFLLSLASEADTVVSQLQACQSILKADRAL